MPFPTLLAAPLKGVIGLVVAVGTALTDASVVAPVGPYTGGTTPPVGEAGAGAGVPATSPALGALEAPSAELPVPVVMYT